METKVFRGTIRRADGASLTSAGVRALGPEGFEAWRKGSNVEPAPPAAEQPPATHTITPHRSGQRKLDLT
jgi:hypothetical protein